MYNTVICHPGFRKGVKQLLVLLNWTEGGVRRRGGVVACTQVLLTYSKYKHMLDQTTAAAAAAHRLPLSRGKDDGDVFLPSRPSTHVGLGIKCNEPSWSTRCIINF